MVPALLSDSLYLALSGALRPLYERVMSTPTLVYVGRSGVDRADRVSYSGGTDWDASRSFLSEGSEWNFLRDEGFHSGPLLFSDRKISVSDRKEFLMHRDGPVKFMRGSNGVNVGNVSHARKNPRRGFKYYISLFIYYYFNYSDLFRRSKKNARGTRDLWT